MSSTIDVGLVPVFVEVVRQGSFTAAGRALSMPKSTVSRHVSRLEQELDAPLLLRSTRKLRLTEAGEAFYARAAPALERLEEAAKLIAEQRDEPQGTLRVTIPPDIGELAAWITRFAARFEKLRVEVVVTNRTVNFLEEGVDVAIRAGRLDDSTLIARRLLDVEFWLFASEAYLERAGEPTTVAELADHQCVVFRPRQGYGRWRLKRSDGAVEEVEVDGPVSADDLLFVRNAVIEGAGIGLLPSTMFGLGRSQGVRRVLPELSTSGGAVSIVYPPARPLPSKVRAFRDFLLEQVEASSPP